MKTGIELIAEERQEQIVKHGRTIERDIVCNDMFQLSTAAELLISEKVHQLESPPYGWDNKI